MKPFFTYLCGKSELTLTTLVLGSDKSFGNTGYSGSSYILLEFYILIFIISSQLRSKEDWLNTFCLRTPYKCCYFWAANCGTKLQELRSLTATIWLLMTFMQWVAHFYAQLRVSVFCFYRSVNRMRCRFFPSLTLNFTYFCVYEPLSISKTFLASYWV